MTQKNSVSVIVPVFNKEKQIEKCLESLVCQNYRNYKVIVIDDGSTDNSLAVAKRFESDKIKVYHKENGGVSSARNYGIDLADSRFIVFVDSDDWVEENYLSDFFIQDEITDTSIAMQSIKSVRSRSTDLMVKYDDIVINKSDFEELICKYQILHNGFPFGKLFSTELIKTKNIRFSNDLPTHEDHIFVVTYMQYVDRIILSLRSNYNYIIDENDGSLSKKMYVPEIYLRASDALIYVMTSAYEKLNLDDEYFNRAITDFGLTQRLRSILSAYIKNYDKSYRIGLLKQEFEENKSRYSNYKSKRKWQDWCVRLLSHIPIRILNCLLYFGVTILGIKGKEIRLYIR